MILDREYERFRGEPNQAKSERLYATLNKDGVFHLNKRIFKMMGNPEAVHLYFNRPKDRIVLEATRLRMPNAFPVREQNGCYKVMAAPFCRHFGISMGATHRFAHPELDGQQLILDLSDTVLVAAKKGVSRKRRSLAKSE